MSISQTTRWMISLGWGVGQPPLDPSAPQGSQKALPSGIAWIWAIALAAVLGAEAENASGANFHRCGQSRGNQENKLLFTFSLSFPCSSLAWAATGATPSQPTPLSFSGEENSSPGPLLNNKKGFPAEPMVWLLKQIDPKKHRLVGQWSFRGERLIGVPGPGGAAALHIPLRPTGTYELQLEFTRLAGGGMVGIFLPVGQRRCAILLDCRPGIHGIDMVAGQRADNNSTTFRGALHTGRPYRLSIRVVPEGSEASVTLTLDDRPWLFYRGPFSQLQLAKEFMFPRVFGVVLFSRSPVAFGGLELRGRSGEVVSEENPRANAPQK